MEPTIHRGSLVFDEIVPVRDLRAGDVITYVPPGRRSPVTHRIISAKHAKGGRVFRTQGDANAAADMRPFQLDKPTQARYSFSIPYLGWLFIALGNPQARLILLALPALLVVTADARPAVAGGRPPGRRTRSGVTCAGCARSSPPSRRSSPSRPSPPRARARPSSGCRPKGR